MDMIFKIFDNIFNIIKDLTIRCIVVILEGVYGAIA